MLIGSHCITCSFFSTCFDNSGSRAEVNTELTSSELLFFSVSLGGLVLAFTICGLVVLATMVCIWSAVFCSGTVLVGPGLTLPNDSRGSLSTLLTTVVAEEEGGAGVG